MLKLLLFVTIVVFVANNKDIAVAVLTGVAKTFIVIIVFIALLLSKVVNTIARALTTLL